MDRPNSFSIIESHDTGNFSSKPKILQLDVKQPKFDFLRTPALISVPDEKRSLVKLNLGFNQKLKWGSGRVTREAVAEPLYKEE